MRSSRERGVPAAVKLLGTVLIVVLPLVVAAKSRPYVMGFAPWVQYGLMFAMVTAGAQVGLIIRRWGNMSLWRPLLDVVLAGVAGVIAYAVVTMAARRGGGPVDPSLVAVFLAYMLAVWSARRNPGGG